MRTGGQMDLTKLLVAFRNFANAANNDHKTAAVNGVSGTCLSVGIAVSVPSKKVTKQIFLCNLIHRCAPRALITDHWKGYLWKPQLHVRICAIFLLTPCCSYSKMLHSRHDCMLFMHVGDPSYTSIFRTFLNDK